MKFLIVTGLSGAGKTSVLRHLEDSGYQCMDNIPPLLLAPAFTLCEKVELDTPVALGVDPGAAKAAPPGGLVGGVYRAHRAELFKMLFHIRVGTAAFGQITHLIDAHCCGTSLCAKLVILPLSNSITP